jgi:hypothetical protein
MEQLSSFTCESGMYHALLLACPQGARKEELGRRYQDKREANYNGACIISPLGICSLTAITSGLYLVQQQTI